MKPISINILGKVYQIEYKDNPSEVDRNQRESLWGQIDFWNRTIRIYDNNRQATDLMQSILHEILHAIIEDLKIKSLQGDDAHRDLDILALALADTFSRNEWFK